MQCVSTPSAPVYQACYTGTACGTTCYRLGDTYKNAMYMPPMSGNTAHGFHVMYTGGDNCTTLGMPRSTIVSFGCQDSAGLLAPSLVVETTSCLYFMMVFSQAGCPQQCPFGGATKRLCAGNGVCDFDTSLGAPRCFCDNGWALDGEGNCLKSVAGNAQPPPVSYSSNIAGGFFGGLFLGAALFIGYVAYLARVRSRRSNTRTLPPHTPSHPFI